ncbi:hypothetical protein B0A49_03852 [Cryomyces minteri]|uniref:Maltose/galactoside acetyltransferase domain-containing protein n=1 Tax=Cryomyces minteri TaxID=331657 RepID=A0A4U0XTX9_9PEZI|nr:hypothetical protein B0A49_03852 [Cryomyces minteri]
MTENEQRQTDLRAAWSLSKEHPDVPYGTPSHTAFTRSSHPGQSSVEDSRAAVAAAATAQLALQHSSEYPRPSTSQLDSERRRMLAGQEFLRFCTQLMDDRDKCTTALWRFNNAGSPNQGVMGVLTRDDRARLFRAIMEPEHLRNPDSSDCPFGRVGESVYVQAPFHCDYGYNIHIGNEVDIGPNCTINDPCTVTIGDRSVLSQNVRICGIKMNEDYRRRNESQGRVAVGMPVTIRNDVFIGCNVTIMPGVVVGEESYVTEDSLVVANVPPRTLVSGRPAQIVHGIDLRSSREVYPPTGPPKDLARWTPRPPEPGRQRDYSGQMDVD